MKVTKLKNGIRLVEVPLRGLHGVTLEAFIKIGSKYETKDEQGLSHFLEHMAFKGTEKRPTATAINNEIDSKGANYNAGTGHEYTSYYITTAGENIEWSFEILSDILFNSIYQSEEIVKERGVIAEEIKMYEDSPMMGLSGDFTKFLYDKSPIGCWDIAGKVADVMTIDRSKVTDFRSRYWNPAEIIVVAAGNVGEKTEDWALKYFGNFSNEKAAELPPVEMVLSADRDLRKKKEVEQGHYCLGVPGIGRRDERKYAFRLLDIILAGNTSSRLYSKIREDRGWAYYVFSISENFEEGGFWGVQTGVKEEKMEEAMDLTEKEILGIKDEVTEQELQRAKEYLNGKLRLGEDRSEFWASFVGRRLLLDGEIKNVDQEIEDIKKVRLDDVKDLAGDIFNKSEIRKVSVRRK